MSAAYLLKNTTINPETREVDGKIVPDYTTIDLTEFKELPFTNHILPNSGTVENASLILNKSEHYWDSMMAFTGRDAILDAPLDPDTLIEAAQETVNEYFKDYKGNIPEYLRESYYEKVLEHVNDDNNFKRYIRMRDKSRL